MPRPKARYGPFWYVTGTVRSGPGNHAKQYWKLKKDHLDYQIIVVRNSCANDEPTQNFDGSRDGVGQVYQARSREKSTNVGNAIPVKSKSVPELVIYNRVPKCGSTTMLQILSHVKDENNFTIFNQIEPNLSVRSCIYHKVDGPNEQKWTVHLQPDIKLGPCLNFQKL